MSVSNSAYLAGAVLGALVSAGSPTGSDAEAVFITLALYLTATAATALSWDRQLRAVSLPDGGGDRRQYTAINSTIQELVPARYRGWADLVINGSFWIGAAIGAVSAICCSILHSSALTMAGGSLISRVPASVSSCS